MFQKAIHCYIGISRLFFFLFSHSPRLDTRGAHKNILEGRPHLSGFENLDPVIFEEAGQRPHGDGGVGFHPDYTIFLNAELKIRKGRDEIFFHFIHRTGTGDFHDMFRLDWLEKIFHGLDTNNASRHDECNAVAPGR